jgi:hypothetical protein
MLSLDRQRQAQETLRQLDEALTADAGVEEAVQQHAVALRDNLFGAFQFIERETLQCRTLLVQTKRIEANQLQVQVRGRATLAIQLDAELAYDQRVSGQGKPELCARCYAVFAPPYHGLLRHYTIFASGEWRRTVFVSRAGATQAHATTRPNTGLDTLVEEAADLLAQLCAVRASWNALADDPGALSLDQLRDRTITRRDPLGIG